MAAVSVNSTARNRLAQIMFQGYGSGVFNVGSNIRVGLIQDTASTSTITSQTVVLGMTEKDLVGGYNYRSSTNAYTPITKIPSDIVTLSSGIVTYSDATFTALSTYNQSIKVYGYYILVDKAVYRYTLPMSTGGVPNSPPTWNTLGYYPTYNAVGTYPTGYYDITFVPVHFVYYDPSAPIPFTTGSTYKVTPKISLV